MGWMDRFSKQEGPDTEPMLQDRSTILAYLEELARLRTPIQIWLLKDDLLPLSARVEGVHEEAGQFTISSQRPLPSDLDTRLPKEMLFTLDGMRFRSPVRFVSRGGYLQSLFQVPDRVFHAERRARMRARFGQREKARVTLLEDLFHGLGATGRLLNLSLEGLGMRLERVIAIPDDRRVPLSTSLFHAGQELVVVRIQDLPHVPMVECGGRVCHLSEGPDGLRMGICLQGLGALESATLHQVLVRRLPTFGRGFPAKRRRSEMEVNPEGEAEREEALYDEPPAMEEADPEGTLDECEPGGPPSTEAPEDVEPESGCEGSNRLIRLRKRGKRLLLIQVDDLDRAILAGTLHVDGYLHVKEARNLLEAIQAIRASTPDLILIEQQIGPHTAQALLDKLRALPLWKPMPVVMLASNLDVRTALMAKAARFAHVVEYPLDYDGKLKGILLKLLGLHQTG